MAAEKTKATDVVRTDVAQTVITPAAVPPVSPTANVPDTPSQDVGNDGSGTAAGAVARQLNSFTQQSTGGTRTSANATVKGGRFLIKGVMVNADNKNID